MKEKTFVVIGGGQAGIQVCNSLRNSGFEGKLILIGDESFLPYQRPPLSKSFLLGEIGEERLLFRPQAHFEKQAIDVILSTRVIAIDTTTKEIKLKNGTKIAYEKLALTTGTRVRKLDCEGANNPKMYYIRNLNDSIALKTKLAEVGRVAIVGGGFVGLEVAAVARKMGKCVTVIEAEKRLMGRVVSPMLSEFYNDLHQKNGVSLMLDTQIDKVQESDDCVTLFANQENCLESDIVVVGIGALANDELASGAGIKCDRGIVVDERCVTSDQDVVAAGDCTIHYNEYARKSVRLESVQNAVDQAKVAASAMLNGDIIYAQVPWFWSDQYDAKLQIAGISGGYDQHLRAGDLGDNKFSIFYFKDNNLIAADSINDPACHMAVRKILAKKNASIADIEENIGNLNGFAKL